MPDEVIDLGGRIVSPGFIECQLNGAYGFNFSTLADDMTQYGKQLRSLNKRLVQTGVTSYIPTVTSQTSHLYKKSLGAHVEGPFLNPTKNGVHNRSVLRVASSLADLEDMYGAANVTPSSFQPSSPSSSSTPTGTTTPTTSTSPPSEIPIKMITVAPELGAMTNLIPELTARGILVSIGHSEATYEEASAAVSAGATHDYPTSLTQCARCTTATPGIFGVLGATEPAPQPQQQTPQSQPQKRPYFGLIA
ncbi:hypothetical protein CHGG_09009 [Chaetomium globosum CBS 148.51]|uniref:N-acetylglucosamine-6-phosphate deacetylase n=1 Tax=Chaetomium globosum (strain ATCC 6205 / CBS 148.51 / DSM 1962 / NBRC 6347 / NRRL 1970) TaxID=306901 RepID=Q2GSP5_CHAGB|nr:uncharacterized protein CHGG_09009 [Chaetomium globosum CBS 148.51]EAQ84995.1 hypothetical protein CHGG_09009 [Chaetomium globosum CBS 148.51]